MCAEMPGKVVEKKGALVKVDFGGILVQAEAGAIDAKVGDFVLVHAGCVQQILSENDKNALLEILKEIDEL